MYTIQTLNKIAAIGTNNFDKSLYNISDNPDNPDAILVRSGDMHNTQFGNNLLAIARAGAGTNNIPVDKCSDMGICVFNTPGANANAVKEMVIAGLLLSSRKVAESMDWVKTLKGKGDEVSAMVEKGKSAFAGPEIAGKTLGIIGLGAIGALVADAAMSLGMKVYGFDPFISVNAAWGLSPHVKSAKSVKEIYEVSDYVTIHMPYNKDTKGTINADAIASMKDGVRILNFARGELVADADIITALESGKVSAYVTDFPTDAQIGAKGVVAIPHLGASTPESEDNCACMAVSEIIDYLENGTIKNSVNLPDAEMSAVGKKVCIIHKNVPKIISQITTGLGNEKLNIENMLNKSKKDYAYTMLDLTGDVNNSTNSIIENLTHIEGVIKVRII